MTGFGVADGPVIGGRLQIEARSVNHRHLNLQLKLDAALQPLESDFRDLVRRHLDRGHVSVATRWLAMPPSATLVRLNLDRARELVGALRELKTALSLAGEIDLAFVARQPEVLSLAQGESIPPAWAEVEPIAVAALVAVNGMRCREGVALAAELGLRLQAIERGVGKVEQRAPARLAAELDRLRRVVADLLAGRSLDEQRLAQELALYADRVDITEEVVRLRTHLQACRTALTEPVSAGRQLGFLSQEMLREINTIGSKANDAAIAHEVIAMKGELEKFREQLENVE